MEKLKYILKKSKTGTWVPKINSQSFDLPQSDQPLPGPDNEIFGKSPRTGSTVASKVVLLQPDQLGQTYLGNERFRISPGTGSTVAVKKRTLEQTHNKLLVRNCSPALEHTASINNCFNSKDLLLQSDQLGQTYLGNERFRISPGTGSTVAVKKRTLEQTVVSNFNPALKHMASKPRLKWTTNAELSLISFYESASENKLEGDYSKNNSKFWDSIAESLNNLNLLNIQINGEQARSKFYALYTKYKETVDKCDDTGESLETWPHFERFEELFGQKTTKRPNCKDLLPQSDQCFQTYSGNERFGISPGTGSTVAVKKRTLEQTVVSNFNPAMKHMATISHCLNPRLKWTTKAELSLISFYESASEYKLERDFSKKNSKFWDSIAESLNNLNLLNIQRICRSRMISQYHHMYEHIPVQIGKESEKATEPALL